MALPWALAVLSLLPLLSAQSPECANFTAKPITNVTLDFLSGKWYYVASIFRKPEFNQSARMIHSAFFYFIPNKTEDTIHIQEYQTIGDRCVFNDSYLTVQRKNGTLARNENGIEFFAHFLHSKNPGTFLFSYYPDDEQNIGITIFSEKPQLSQEQVDEFHEAIACMGMHKSEIIHTDEKDLCGPLEKQHEEERKKEQEGAKEGGALG
ncbi:PREDICTED: alpha-1-acid glycoprotein 1 [Condylura cristata]|uniref:alpha-1-acid glycoprotein 1 n=1 Tax=Condylura cristata TaxID=143302 RepID=UPI000334731E|nr:PREDICTED: alpha-1-acid glycoprotein 1 [Condylura cristata]